MNLFRRILIVICCHVFSLGFAVNPGGPNGQFYYQTEVENEDKTITEKLYYDASSIERPQKGIVRVTQKVTKLVSRRKNGDRQQDETDRDELFFP